MFHSKKRQLNLIRCLIVGIILAFTFLLRSTQPVLADEPDVTQPDKPITVEAPPVEICWQADQCRPWPFEKPVVISRTDWGCPDGQDSPRRPPQYTEVTHVIIHQAETPNDIAPYQDYAGWVRSIWDYHANVLGWGDVGYNYLIDPNGVIYEGRAGGDNVIGVHDTHNEHSLSIGLIGCYDNCDERSLSVAEPSEAMLDSTAKLIAWKLEQQGIDPLSSAQYDDLPNISVIAGGRDVVITSSPGDNIYNKLPDIPARIEDIRARMEKEALNAIAARFAPVLAFDSAHKGLPMSAQVYFNNVMEAYPNPTSGEIVWGTPYYGPRPCPDPVKGIIPLPGRDDRNPPRCGMSNNDRQTLKDGEVPTYFRVIKDCDFGGKSEGRLRIAYWWFYGWQEVCSPVFGDDGAHHGDWEHILVTTSPDRSKIDYVTYVFHGVWYTRQGFPTWPPQGERPLVYVGKLAHGSYHSDDHSGWMVGSPHHCCEYADYRNPVWKEVPDGTLWHTHHNLVALDGNSEPWMLADRIGSAYEYNGQEYTIKSWRWGPVHAFCHFFLSPWCCFADDECCCDWGFSSAPGTHPTVEKLDWTIRSCKEEGCGTEECENAIDLPYTYPVYFNQPWPWDTASGAAQESDLPSDGDVSSDWQAVQDNQEQISEIMFNLFSESLGVSVAELELAVADGQTLCQVAEARKLDLAKEWLATKNARQDIVQQAVKDGTLTQTQADWISQLLAEFDPAELCAQSHEQE